jgi:hypothetical protein
MVIRMCPDRQILSVYVDGELPSPWKEKLESHLASCPGCRRYLEDYRRISAFASGEDTRAAADRVWQKLAGSGIADRGVHEAGGGFGRHDPGKGLYSRRFRGRSVELPLPAAIAAAALLIVTLTLTLVNITGRISGGGEPAVAAGMNRDLQDIVPVSDVLNAPALDLSQPYSDLNNVLRYLEGEDTADFMIIRLPETKSFSSTGQPMIIKASDYSRRTPGR